MTADDPTLPARPSRRSPSAQTLRLGEALRPHLLRWAAAQTREERVCAWVEALTAIADDGARRRADVERERDLLRGELDQTRQALSLSEEHRRALLRRIDALQARLTAAGGTR